MSIDIRPVTAADRAAWAPLWYGYLEFYQASIPADVTEATFARLAAREIQGALAWEGDRAVGLVHWLTHPATWSIRPYCYLEDLFAVPEARGTGVGRALIEHVVDWAREHEAHKVYWLTQAHNETARRLYDRVATDTGFVQYSIAL